MHGLILMLAKNKFNSMETLISQVLNDMKISHEEFITIFKEKYRYEKMKENIRDKNENEKQEIIKLSNIKSKNKMLSKKFIYFSCIYKNVRDNKKKLL